MVALHNGGRVIDGVVYRCVWCVAYASIEFLAVNDEAVVTTSNDAALGGD